MRFRVLIVVVTIAVAVHALIFIALGRVAKGAGPLIPVPTAVATKPAAPAAAPTPPPSAPAPAKMAPAAQSPQMVKRPRRSHTHAATVEDSRPPIFDVNAGGDSTSNAAR